jgi:hypothetical protein
MTHILIGTPCYNGLVTAEYLVSMLGLQTELIRHGITFEVETPTTVSLIPVARNYLVGEVLGNPRFTHLLFIDADLGFEPALLPRLVAAEKDVVAGIYPLKNLNVPAIRDLPPDKPIASTYHYAVSIAPGAQPNNDGFVQAEYAATGFMLIRRSVLEQMAARYPELKYTHMFTLPGAEIPPVNDHLYALFDTSLDPARGLYLPEDYTFCQRWRNMGGEIWVDVFSKFRHVGSFAHEGDFSVFVNRS